MLLFSKLSSFVKARRLRLRTWPLMLLLLFLAGCSSVQERVWLDAPGWQRGIAMGRMLVPDAATLALDGERTLYTFLITGDGPTVVALDRRAERLWQRSLDIDLQRPDRPQLVWDGAQLRLFWIDGERLYTAAMDAAGNVVEDARPLSGETRVATYDVAVDNGRIAVWSGGPRREPGVYALDLGAASAGPRLVDEVGIRPQLAYDAQGVLHAIWTQYPSGAGAARFLYAQSDSQPPSGTIVLETLISVTSSMEGPFLGIEEETAYLFWSVLVRTGLGAGTATTEYVTFPLGQPQAASAPARLYVPSAYDLPYGDAPAAGSLQAGGRAPLDAGGRATPLSLEANDLIAGELVVAARATVAFQLRKEASQATLVFLDGGAPQGYQLLSFTRTATSSPYVRSDGDGYLYATWLEPAEPSGYHVYFASTAPDISAALQELRLADVQQMAVETIFGMLAGAVLAPFVAILWLIAPIIILGVTSFMRREGASLISAGTAISLALALAAFLVVKGLTLPGLNEYVPFSAWIPIMPRWLETVLRWSVPVLIPIVGLAAAWHLTFRRRNQSVLYFLLIYAAADSLLSMAIYGSVVYGFI
ncbi:MAG TPA: hypothetical protein VK879_19370 [Candidatus Sulfomarinibacteraceae bacterium]|nr:hypothetical protein [Candidatus Sulfomarinibacteraceae bacterium]